MKLCQATLLAGLLAAAPAWAQTIDRLQNLAQQEFRLLSEDLGGALSYHPQTPTAPLGITGFDVGFALTGARLHNTSVLERASSDSVPGTLPIPTLRAHKGLPAGFDVGVMYASIPSSNIRYYGGELRYAIIEGDAVAPAIGVRAASTSWRSTRADSICRSPKALVSSRRTRESAGSGSTAIPGASLSCRARSSRSTRALSASAPSSS